MTSSKPYLLRALYEWILDNGLTPHLIVDADAADVDVPESAIQDGRLVLNVSPAATRDLELENEAVTFQARFAGSPRHLYLPMASVLAIYARENGQGMMFAEETEDSPPDPGQPTDKTRTPTLRVVK
jgi:stringent starvation protein B